ncbi:MAG: M56 family metallopeptidase [Clostridiaceae bacterium]|jgi:beta-lactamase regulating signal transducer with metallopeptidase domain|nr:M56 family metallopeptidase [Clostridiaceae bacterium]
MITDVFLEIVNMSLTASYVILAVLLLRLLLRRFPAWLSYALWAVVLIRLVLPFSFESALALIPGARAVSPVLLQGAQPAIASQIPAIDRAVNSALAQAAARSEMVSPLEPWLAALAWIWLAGIGILLLSAAWTGVRFFRHVRFAIRIGDDLYSSDRIDTAFVAGIFRPRIYLPAALDETQRDLVIEHERAHIRRQDHRVKPLAYLVLALHWFNPLVWISYKLMTRDMERACDARVVRALDPDGRKQYAATLLRFAAVRSRLASPLAFGENSARLRIRQILATHRPAAWLTALALVAAVILGGCLLANPPAQAAASRIPAGILKTYPQADLKEPDQIELQMAGQTFRFEKGSEDFAALYEAVRENWWIHQANGGKVMQDPVYYFHTWTEEDIGVETNLLTFGYAEPFTYACPRLGAGAYTVTGYVFKIRPGTSEYALVVDGSCLGQTVFHYDMPDALAGLVPFPGDDALRAVIYTGTYGTDRIEVRHDKQVTDPAGIAAIRASLVQIRLECPVQDPAVTSDLPLSRIIDLGRAGETFSLFSQGHDYFYLYDQNQDAYYYLGEYYKENHYAGFSTVVFEAAGIGG